MQEGNQLPQYTNPTTNMSLTMKQLSLLILLCCLCVPVHICTEMLKLAITVGGAFNVCVLTVMWQSVASANIPQELFAGCFI